MNKKNQLGIILFAFIAVFAGMYFFSNKPYEFNGAVIDPAQPAFQFELTVPGDDRFKLSDTLGKVVLIFFGYTNCPDFCPTTLNDFKIIQTKLEELADQVEFLFISIDPDRDTPESIWAYTQAFNPTFFGLSGTEEELMPIWGNYWVYRAKSPGSPDEGYLMDHSTRVIVIDTFGNFRMTFPNGMEPTAMASDVIFLISENE